SARKRARPRVSCVYVENPKGIPVRVDENSASQATGQTHPANPRTRRQPRSAAPATRKTARKAKTYGRSTMVQKRGSIREVSVIQSACYHHAREAPAGRDRPRPGASAWPAGSRWTLDRPAPSPHDAHFRVPPSLLFY